MPRLVQTINKFSDGTETIYNFTENAFADQIEQEVQEAVEAKESQVVVEEQIEEEAFEPNILG